MKKGTSIQKAILRWAFISYVFSIIQPLALVAMPSKKRKGKEPATSSAPALYTTKDSHLSPVACNDTLWDDIELPDSLVEVLYNDTAPQQIKDIITILNDPEKHDPERPQALILHGPNGTGKSILAEVIAKKTGRRYKNIQAPSLRTIYDSSDSYHLSLIIDPIQQQNEPYVIAIDEIDEVLKKRQNGPGDSSHSAEGTISGILNNYKDNKNMFFVWTTNNIKEVPPKISTRNVRVVKIDANNREIREKIIRYWLDNLENTRNKKSEPTYTRDKSFEKYITQLAEKTTDYSPRELELLVKRSRFFAHETTARPTTIMPEITPDCLEKSFKAKEIERKAFKKGFWERSKDAFKEHPAFYSFVGATAVTVTLSSIGLGVYLYKDHCAKLAKEESDRLAREEADRLARLAREQAERLAKEQRNWNTIVGLGSATIIGVCAIIAAIITAQKKK